MNKIKININPEVKSVFSNYPDFVRNKLLDLRKLIIDSASEVEEIKELEETLKWSEPSYVSKIGSTIRIDWKSKTPNQYAIYFKCTSRLVETFKLIFNNTFNYEGKRAIIFQLEDEIPTEELVKCIKTALTYHKVKHLPTLGL